MACLQSAAGAGMNGSSIMPSVSSSLSSGISAPTTPYPNPSPSSTTSHYNMYKDYKDNGYPGMSSSIASLRLKVILT